MSDISAAQVSMTERVSSPEGARLRKAIVTDDSPLTLNMSGAIITSPPRSPSYYPVVNDLVLVLMDGPAPYVLERVSPTGSRNYTPSMSYSGGGGSMGTSPTITGNWDFNGSRIEASVKIQFGSSPSAGTGQLQFTPPVAGITNIGASNSALPMIGFGYYFQASTGKLWFVQVRLMAATTCQFYIEDRTTGSQYPVSGSNPFAVAVSNELNVNLSYFPIAI